jgi:transcription elongation factor Elf1
MTIKFNCPICGNKDTSKTHYHDGVLGYEATVCKVCGTYSDHIGNHLPDTWSLQFVNSYQFATNLLPIKTLQK